MKRWKIWGSILIALITVLAIVFATPIFDSEISPSVSALENPDFWLWAGQTTLVGTGNVTNDGSSMHFTIDPDCAISLIHIKIFDDPPTEGNPAPGLFPYVIDYTSDPQTDEFGFSIPFDPDDWDSPIYIALHAEVICGFYAGNTAWAGGETPEGSLKFPGLQWAYYFQYTIE